MSGKSRKAAATLDPKKGKEMLQLNGEVMTELKYRALHMLYKHKTKRRENPVSSENASKCITVKGNRRLGSGAGRLR